MVTDSLEHSNSALHWDCELISLVSSGPGRRETDHWAGLRRQIKTNVSVVNTDDDQDIQEIVMKIVLILSPTGLESQ